MNASRIATFFVLLVSLSGAAVQTPARSSGADVVDKLADDFWTWRAKYAPFTGDDVNRIERPGGIRDWSRAAIDRQRKDLAEFEARWKKIDANGWPIPKQVDYRLIGSALGRVRWELDINPRWKRDPTFYIEQTLTPLVEALTVPAPYDEARSREILTRLENIPAILQQGEANLDKPPAQNGGRAAKLDNAQGAGIKRRGRSRRGCPRAFSNAASGTAAIACERNRSRPRRLRFFSEERRPHAVLARRAVGHGTTRMESRSRI
jgi:hypothetical protein